MRFVYEDIHMVLRIMFDVCHKQFVLFAFVFFLLGHGGWGSHGGLKGGEKKAPPLCTAW